MRKTPREIAECGNPFEIEEWLLTASAKEICGFIPHKGVGSHDFEFAKIALNIRIAKSADRTNRILIWLTVGIFIFTAVLVTMTLSPIP